MRIVPEGLVFRAIRAEAPDPPPVPFGPWRLPGFEGAPPPEAIPESHVRELLSRYFRHQGFACAATELAVAEAALARAEAYGAGNEVGSVVLSHSSVPPPGR